MFEGLLVSNNCYLNSIDKYIFILEYKMLLQTIVRTAQLNEARQSALNYSFKEVKGKLDKITVKLNGNESGVFTKIAQRYKEIDNTVKALEVERNTMNEQIKEKFGDYFDEATDTVVTRIIETVSLTMQLSKRAEPEMGKDKVDYEKALLILADMLPELHEKIAEVKKMCTTAGSMSVPKSPALTVKINEDLTNKIFALLKRVMNWASKIKVWGKNYDAQLAKLQALV